MIRRALFAFALALTSGVPEARAEPQRVQLVCPASARFRSRVRAEIEAIGLAVEDAAALDEDASPTAPAAVRVLEAPPSRRVEIWILEPARARLELRVVLPPPSTGDDATQAVRVAEQLRALLQPPSRPAPLPPQRDAPPSFRAVPRFVIGAGFAATLQPGTPGLDLMLRARWMATPAFGLGAFGALPLLKSNLNTNEGSSGQWVALFGPELTTVVVDKRPLRLTASAGVALAWLHTSELASAPPRSGRSNDTTTALPFVGISLGPRLGDRVHLELGGHLGFWLPSANVAIAGRGRLMGLFMAGLSIDF